MSINNDCAYHSKVGEVNESTNLIVTLDGINTLSVIFQCLGGGFENESYSVHVSNNGEDWTPVYNILLGFGSITTNSFNYNSPNNAVLFFRFVKFSVPILGGNKRSKISVSAK